MRCFLSQNKIALAVTPPAFAISSALSPRVMYLSCNHSLFHHGFGVLQCVPGANWPLLFRFMAILYHATEVRSNAALDRTSVQRPQALDNVADDDAGWVGHFAPPDFFARKLGQSAT